MIRPILLTAVLALACSSLNAADWAHWRGPNFNGTGDATDLPTDFSKTKHVKWTADMAGPSAATPIVWQDKVFTTAADAKSGQLLAICLDRASGKVVWSHNASSGYKAGGAGTATKLDSKSTYASPSPVTDGQRVVFFYGNGDLVTYSMDGKKLWTRNLQKDYGDFTFQWTFSASPTLLNGKIYMQILQRDEVTHGRGKQGQESFLLCVNPDNGETIWKHIRPSKAKKESLESFGTPIPYERDGKTELLIAGGDVITAHVPETGKELWRTATWNPNHSQQWWRLVPSPVAGAGVVLACAPKKAPVYAFKPGVSGDAGKVWDSGAKSVVTSDVPTPAFIDGKFYVLSDLRKAISRVEPKTGKIEWTTQLPGPYKWRGSPTGADGKIWFMNHHGDVIVIHPADGKIIANIPMGEDGDDNIRASIAAAGSQIFIRTNSKLFCVAK
jgi:outer membrane protein assembly factor BamB